MSYLSGVNSISFFVCGVLDGSNAEPMPKGRPTKALAAPIVSPPAPVQAKPVTQPFVPDPLRWAVFDNALDILLKSGLGETDDKKVRIEAYSLALKDPTLDHASVDSHIKATIPIFPAITLFGQAGPDGKFFVNEYPDLQNAKALIVVQDTVANKAVAGLILSHEVSHALDLFSGKHRNINSQVELLMNASRGGYNDKALLGGKTVYLILEMRANMFQLDWALSHETAYAANKKDIDLAIAGTVMQLNAFYGYKSYLYDRNTITVNGSPMLFNMMMDNIFEIEIPSSKINEMNRFLKPHKVIIDPSHRNQPIENQEMELNLVPQKP
jgi:hypothetical protein